MKSLTRLALATQNRDDVEGKNALRAQGASGEENSKARHEIRGLTKGDWRGLGNYLWKITLVNGNWAERQRDGPLSA